MGAFRGWARRAHCVASLHNKKSNLDGKRQKVSIVLHNNNQSYVQSMKFKTDKKYICSLGLFLHVAMDDTANSQTL